MRKLANIISANIYIFIVKQFTKETKDEILKGKSVSSFGADLVFSWFVFMILIMLSFYVIIWIFQFFVSLNQTV